MHRQQIMDDFRFLGHSAPPVVGSPDGTIWRKALTGSAAVATANLGLITLALDATNEAQNACLYFGDVLSYDIGKLVSVDIWASLTASFAAANTLSFGLASARNATPESMTALALFKCVGNNNVVVSTDDNVTDTTDIATGMTLGTTLKRFNIDFHSGINSVVGGNSTGGKSNVIFSMENDRGELRRVCPNQRFDLSAYSAGLQPFVQIQKTAGVTTGTASVKRIVVTYKNI